MGKIFYIIGKSASGKDTVFHELLKSDELKLRRLILYTTRPIRDGEKNGREYYFTDKNGLEKLREEGKVIEERDYYTIHGIWTYFTADDGQINLKKADYLGIGTLESLQRLREFFGKDTVCPIYIEVEDGERLSRALKRERLPENQKYAEMCRRFLADQEDFAEERLTGAGIWRRFENMDLETCVREIILYINSTR